MKRKHAAYSDRVAALLPKLEAWRELVAKEATVTARAVLELFAEQHLKLPKDHVEFEADLIEASAAAGDLIARKVVESLFVTTLPSEFARLSRTFKTSNAGFADREKKGGRPAPWKIKALKLLNDGRLKLAKKSNDIIIDELVNRHIIAQKGDSYEDAETNQQCAKDQKEMRTQISKLKKKALGEKALGSKDFQK